jgi:hypothetical protein
MRPYLEKTHHKNRAGGVAQGESPALGAITKYHILGGLNNRYLFFSCFWRLEVQDNSFDEVSFLT